MKAYSKNWIGSKKPGKQRKYRFKAPLHIKQKLVGAHLHKDLRKKYGIRSISARKGDKVKVLRGQFRKKEGKVERVSLKRTKAYITGLEVLKKEGGKTLYPFNPSNLMITDLDISDKKRFKRIKIKK